MLIVERKPNFLKKINKIKDNFLKNQIKKQTKKIIDNPEVGKPMKYERRGTREVYINPFRLAYAYLPDKNKVIFLDLYHKDEQ